MSEIKLNVPESALLPENDLQELWVMYGKLEALRGMIQTKMAGDSNALFYGREICALMGWKNEC